MTDIILTEGQNELNIEMVPMVPITPGVGQWVSPPTGIPWSTRSGRSHELTIEPIMCSGIRFKAVMDAYWERIFTIDIQSNGTWHRVYSTIQDELPRDIWTIVSFAPQLVTGARITVESGIHYFNLSGFEFWWGTDFPGVEPGAGFAYASNVRYSSMLIDRKNAQVFEVDVINLSTEARECVLECYIQIQPVSDEGVPGSRRDWVPDTYWDGEIELYRVKRALLYPTQVVTFRGISNYHFFGEYDHRLWAKFVGEPGEIVSSMVNVEPYG